MPCAFRAGPPSSRTNWRWIGYRPTQSPYGSRSRRRRFWRKSDGRLQIRVFPGAVLASSVQQNQMVRTGALRLGGASYNVLQNTVPLAGIIALPFIFSGHAQAVEAINSRIGKTVRDAISKTGLYVFDGVWDGSFQEITTSVRPIVKPDDLKGLKVARPRPGLVSHVSCLRSVADAGRRRRDLHRGADAHRRRDCSSVGNDSRSKDLRGPKIRVDHQSALDRLHVDREPRCVAEATCPFA